MCRATITCIWCGHSIKIAETSGTPVWPPKHTLCCQESIRRWEKENKESNKSVWSKIFLFFRGKQ